MAAGRRNRLPYRIRGNKSNFCGGRLLRWAAKLGEGSEVLAIQRVQLAEDAIKRGGAEGGAVGAGERVGRVFAA